jgi:hypothetical protein
LPTQLWFGIRFSTTIDKQASKKQRNKEGFIFSIGPHLQIIKKRVQKKTHVHTYMKGGKVQRSNAKMKQWCAQAMKVWCQGYGVKMWL